MINAPQWLLDFFAKGNLLSLQKLLGNDQNAYSDEQKNAILPLVESALDGQWPIILPWCNKNRWVFFAAAQTERAMVELSNVLNARLGSADVRPGRIVTTLPTPGDTSISETVLLQHCKAGIIRIELLPKKQSDQDAKARVFAALKDVITLFRERPVLVRTIKRPFGRILSDFMLANSEKDEAAGTELLKELKNNGALSRRNLMLLELQQAGKLEKWETLLNHSSLPDLIRGRIPSSLMRMLLNAHQQQYFTSADSDYPLSSAETLRPQCQALQTLFMQVPFLSKDDADLQCWKSWSIGVALTGDVGLLNALPETLKTEWLAGLQAWSGRPLPLLIAPAPQQNLAQPGTLQQLADYLQSSLTAGKDAIPGYAETLQHLDPQLLAQATAIPLLKALIDEIGHQANPQLIGWDMCFMQLCQPEADGNKLVQLVALESDSWPVDSFSENTFLHLLSNPLPTDAFPTLRNIMPGFIEWLDRTRYTLSSTTWLKLIDVLAMEQSVSQSDVKLATLVSDRLLQGSVSQDDYLELIAMLELIVERSSSLRNLSTLGELMELFLDAPVQEPSALRSLWFKIQEVAIRLWPRLDSPSRAVMCNLAVDILGNGAQAAFPADQEARAAQEEEALPDLSKARVAIYSLTEGAARRAKGMLETLFTGIRVDINHAHTATDKLVNLAQQADYFIFSAGSATHQAFYAVSACRDDLIYPLGKGAGSMLNAFIDHVRQKAM